MLVSGTLHQRNLTQFPALNKLFWHMQGYVGKTVCTGEVFLPIVIML